MLIWVRQLVEALEDLGNALIVGFPLIVVSWWLLSRWRGRFGGYRLAMLTSGVDMVIATAALSALYLVSVPIQGVPDSSVNLVPGADIHAGLSGRESIWQIMGNLLLLSPLGALVPLRLRTCAKLSRVACMAVLCAGFVELAQYMLITGRVSTTDDVLLNATGAVLGALLTQRWWRAKPVRTTGRHAVSELGRHSRQRWLPSNA